MIQSVNTSYDYIPSIEPIQYNGSSSQDVQYSIGGIVGSVVGGNTDIFGSLFGDIFNNTLGSVFANGLNFSCWNVSTSPAAAAQWFETKLFPCYQNMVSAINNASTIQQKQNQLNKLEQMLKAIQEHQMFHKSQSTSSCSKEGNQLKADAAAQLSLSLIQVANELGYEVSKISKSGNATQVNWTCTERNWKGRTNRPFNYTQYKLTDASSGIGGVIGGIFNGGANSNGTTKQLSGANWLLILLVLGMLFTKQGKRTQKQLGLQITK